MKRDIIIILTEIICIVILVIVIIDRNTCYPSTTNKCSMAYNCKDCKNGICTCDYVTSEDIIKKIKCGVME